jgi:hypothetical protein
VSLPLCRADALYQSHYCEENVWQLAAHPALAGRRAWAVFISNPARACALWSQHLAAPGEPVLWDYHVVLAAERTRAAVEVFDLDTTLPFPVSLQDYLAGTFPFAPRVPAEVAPRFRVIAAPRFREVFASDRSHMRDARGTYQQPPPPWPAPRTERATMNLFDFVDTERAFEGVVLELDALVAFFSAAG